MRRAVYLSLFLVFAATTAHGATYFKSLGIPPKPQSKNYYCAAAIVEMWIDWLEGDSPTQTTIATDQGITATKGLNANELPDALEDYSSNWFNRVEKSTKEALALVMVQEINSGEPVAVVGNTRRKNGTTSANSHWLLVDSFWLSTASYSTAWASLNGFYMNDPLYNSAFTSTYYYLTPTTYVAKATFFTTIASTSNKNYNLVRD